VDYPFSSERTYAGETAQIPTATAALKTALELHGYHGPRDTGNSWTKMKLPMLQIFCRTFAGDPRIAGDKVFVQKARNMAAIQSRRQQEQLVAGVARLLNKTPADVLSPTHIGALGRALVACMGCAQELPH